MLKEAYGECASWSVQFEQFVRAGESSEEFDAHLHTCSLCQAAVEKAFQKSGAAFDEVARDLRKSRLVSTAGSSDGSESSHVLRTAWSAGTLQGIMIGFVLGMVAGMLIILFIK